ncbi:copper amine oxidase N-terminal domain-containing protein [Paenibacillus sp. DCT19]|uniref:copper amine oxidase N-terminal domain-containing protein n=1 Tax=Paenibacillus sp. DCT19 TaxID=2211212 RepID=UPI000FE183F5|nr:copper amine oxidase N-terminal domain-containing protein [Paenibacillus sp. DCT19]
MKKKVVIIMALLLTLIVSSVSADARKNVIVDGQTVLFDQNPIVVNGTTLVQFTPVFKKLGITSTWDQQKKQVVATKGGTKIILNVGNKTAYVNGSPVELQVAPTVVGGKVFVPLRFISEATGASLNVTNSGNNIEVYSGNSTTSSNQTVTPSSKPSTTKIKPSSQQLENYLDQNHSILVADGSLYEVSYVGFVEDRIVIGVSFDYENYGTLINNAFDHSHIFKLMKPVAQDLQAKYGPYDVNMVMYLDFESPIYTTNFGVDNIEALNNGNYHVLKSVFYLNFLAKTKEFEGFLIDDEELIPMYSTTY